MIKYNIVHVIQGCRLSGRYSSLIGCTILNFHGSLISRIFNHSQKYFNENFDMRRAVCVCSVCVQCACAVNL